MIGADVGILADTKIVWGVIGNHIQEKRDKLSKAWKISAQKRRGTTSSTKPSPKKSPKPAEWTSLNDSSNTISTGSKDINKDITLEELDFETIANMAIVELTKNKVIVTDLFEPSLHIEEDLLDTTLENRGNENIAKIVKNIHPYFFEFPEHYLYDFSDWWKFTPKYNSKKDWVSSLWGLGKIILPQKLLNCLKK